MPKIQTDTLIEQLSSAQKATTRLSPPMVLFAKAALAAALYLAVLLAIAGLRSDINPTLFHPLFMAEIGLALVTAITAMAVSIFFAFPDRQPAWYVKAIPVSLFVLFNSYLAYQFFSPEPLYRFHDQTHAFSYECMRDIILFSLFPLIMVFYILKIGAVITSVWAAATASIAAACLSYLVVRFMEANDNIMHLMQWHYLPMLGVIILGLVIGKKILKW